MLNEITPNVNFMLKFYLPNYDDPHKQDDRAYYSSNKNNDYLKYVDTGIKDLKNIDFVEYANNSSKSSGIFNASGRMKKDEIKELRKNLRKTESIIWSGIISFEKDFGLKWCFNYEQAENIVQKELPKFFKRVGLKPDNMEWFAGLHENTDNRHIHLVFFEKEAIRKSGNRKHFSRGLLSEQGIAEFKANIELCATDYKAREIKIRTSITKAVKENLNGISTIKLKSMLINLADKFPLDGHTYYDSENMLCVRQKVDEITNYIFKRNDKIQTYKNDFDNVVQEKDDLLKSYCKRNGYGENCKSVGDKMRKDLYHRVGNLVIEKAKELKKDETERLKFNAKYKVEKRLQKNKLSYMLNECMRLNSLVEYEAIKAFQDHMRKLDEMRIKTMIEQGLILQNDGFEMS